MPIRIGIIGHFTLVREALKDLLSKHAGFSVVELSGCDIKAVRTAKKWKAELFILDLLQDRFIGQSMVKELKNSIPGSKILVISTAGNGAYIWNLFKAGATGFCLNSDRYSEVFSAIQHVLAGKYYLTASALDQFVRTALAEHKNSFFDRSNPSLTVRENEILKLISEGYRTKDIAGLLNLSSRTVEKHRYNIMKKLNIHRTSDLVHYEKERNVVLQGFP